MLKAHRTMGLNPSLTPAGPRQRLFLTRSVFNIWYLKSEGFLADSTNLNTRDNLEVYMQTVIKTAQTKQMRRDSNCSHRDGGLTQPFSALKLATLSKAVELHSFINRADVARLSAAALRCSEGHACTHTHTHTTPHHTTPHHTTPHHTTPHHTTPHHTTPHHTTPHHTTTHHNTPQHNTPHHNTTQHNTTHHTTPHHTTPHTTHNTPHHTPHTTHNTQRTAPRSAAPRRAAPRRTAPTHPPTHPYTFMESDFDHLRP